MRLRHLLALVLAATPAAAFWPFKQKRFTAEALLNAGSLGVEGGRVVAIGDVNGDQNLDLFVLKDEKTLQVYLWNRDAFRYTLGTELKFERPVVNVVPGDFNGDGRLDILVMTLDAGSSWWSGKGKQRTDMEVILGAEGGLGTGPRWTLASSTLPQPLIFDHGATLLPSLLGFVYDEEAPDGVLLQSWRNRNGSGLAPEQPPLYPSVDVCTLVTPHSSAYVDLNGDCLPDIVLHCGRGRANDRKIQVWLNGGKDGYALGPSFDLPTNSKAVSFADMNRDGSIDMVFATCDKHATSTGEGSGCAIHVAYNDQAPLCATENSWYDPGGRLMCRGWGRLCEGDASFAFQMYEGSEYMSTIKLEDLFPGERVKLLLNAPGERDVPLPIRPGDYDVDGFPDLLITVANATASRVHVLHNVPCGKGVLGCDNTKQRGARGFVVARGKGWEALDAIADATGASWIDLDDDGSLDIMVQRTGKQDGERVTFIQNNFYNDAFFLKAQVLNGACDRECEPTDGGKQYSALGASYSGATFKLTVFDTAGRRHAQQVVQLPQTSYQSLQTPHTFIGLGRTNNYVERLAVGTSLAAPDHWTLLESLIPNSQVLINPPWPGAPPSGNTSDTSPVKDRSTEWRSELYLHPGDVVPWVAAAVIGTVVTLGIVVVWLGEREKREDEKERRRALHAINFQAL